MKPLWWMVATATASWMLITVILGPEANPEVLFGMVGPLVVAGATWVVTERTYKSDPQRLTAVMIKGLAIKAVFFGVYVAVMLRPLAMRATPFVASFTGFFIGLHMMEALFMRRLFTDGMRAFR
jgi:hypothetical protein